MYPFTVVIQLPLMPPCFKIKCMLLMSQPHMKVRNGVFLIAKNRVVYIQFAFLLLSHILLLKHFLWKTFDFLLYFSHNSTTLVTWWLFSFAWISNIIWKIKFLTEFADVDIFNKCLFVSFPHVVFFPSQLSLLVLLETALKFDCS